MRLVVGLGIASAVAIWIVACVGDNPSPGVTPDPNVPAGQYKGACSDGKCLEGLVCNQGVCLYPGDGAPPNDASGSSSGGSSSGGSSSGGSSGAAAVPCAAPADTGNTTIACGGASGGFTCTTECCLGETGPSACDGNCSIVPNRRSLKCDSKYQCTSTSDECCLLLKDGAVIDQSKCPSPVAFVDLVESACTAGGCDTSAGSGQYKMCRSDSECTPPAKCRQIEISNNGGTKMQLAICQ